jgi:hypothetical protein
MGRARGEFGMGRKQSVACGRARGVLWPRRSVLLGLAAFVPAPGAEALESGATPRSGASLRLNDAGYQHAVQLIDAGKVALDKRGEWSVHRPTPAQEDAFIESHGYAEYGAWFLAVNDAFSGENRRHYAFPYGDFQMVHRSGLLAVQYRAREWGHADVLAAAERLLAMIEASTPA